MLGSLFPRRALRRAHGAAARPRRTLAESRRKRAGSDYAFKGEILEPRSMLAVSASVSFGELLIKSDAADDASYLSITGGAYAVTGTSGSPVAGSPFSGVTGGVRVIGTADPNQSFTFGGTSPLGVRLTIDSTIEAATINEAIDAAGIPTSSAYVTIAASSITLGADITTTGDQTYFGAVTLSRSVSLASTAGAVNFRGTVDAAASRSLDVSFAPRTRFATGYDPWSVSMGDVNGDGKPDLTTTNGGSASVSVLLNTTAPGATTPSFALQTQFATGIRPESLWMGDVNGDGKPDLAIVNGGSDSVSVLLNTTATGATTPSFAPQAQFATGSAPRSVSMGDIDGDGKPDLAIANAAGSVCVLLNRTAPGDTTPSFATQEQFATGSNPQSVSLGDIDGDGKPDLAIANLSSDSVSVLLNTTAPGATTASFAPQHPFATGSGPNSVSMGDFNGDGKPDLAVVNGGSVSVSVLLNTTAPGASTPTFVPQTQFTTGRGPNSVSIGDINGDGRPDLAIVNFGSNSVSVLLNTTATGATTPSFAPQAQFKTDSFALSASMGDVNGDGKPDLAISNFFPTGVSVLLNQTGSVGLTVSSSKGTTIEKSVGSTTPLDSISIHGPTSLGGNVTTAGDQTYSGAVTLFTDTTLTGETITNGATLDGGIHALSIFGDAAVFGPISGVTNYSVSGSTNLGANIKTIGTQTYSGLVTLSVDTTLTGTDPAFTNGIEGKGHTLSLDFSGATAIDGALFTGLNNLSTGNGGRTTLSGAITTTGKQTYADAVTLSADTTLTGTDPTFTNGVAGNGNSLSLDFSGSTAIDGALFTGLGNLSTGKGGTTTLAGAIATTGTQTYSDAVMLFADTTLAGMTITNFWPIQGGIHSLTVSGNAVVNGPISGVTNFTVSGSTSLGANVTTSGLQTYAGLVKLSADATLTGTAPMFAVGVAGNGNSLSLDFTGTTAIDGALFTGLAHLSTGNGGTTTLTGAITTTGMQTYRDAVTLLADTIFTGTTITNGSTIDGAGHAITVAGNAAVNGAISGVTTYAVNGTSSLRENVTTTGDQTYSGAVTIAGNPSLVTSAGAVAFKETVDTSFDVSFATPAQFATGQFPQSVSIGDINGDGKPDLAIANEFSYSVSVLLNTTPPGATTPSFAPQTRFGTGGHPKSVAMADINRDGRPDLAIANSYPGSVSVLLNTTAPGATTPSFTRQAEFAAGGGARSVSIGDFNGDGTPDLAIANPYSDSASVLLNTTTPGATTPSFAPQAQFATGSGPWSVSIGDLDGDDKFDFAIANLFSDSVSVLLNTTSRGNTTPSFAPQTQFATGRYPISVSIGDFDGDGKPDLAIANSSANSANVLLNTTVRGDTKPSFAPEAQFATGRDPCCISIGDLDRNGEPDLVTANFSSDTVSVLLNTRAPGSATPSFAPQTQFVAGSSPISVTTGDINGDGKPDLAIANQFSDSVSVLLNTAADAVLTVSSSKGTTFQQAVGSLLPLLSLAIVAGPTNLAANITTTGTQSFAGEVVLTKSVALESTGGKDVTFGQAINSAAGLANSLTVTTAGTTTLGGNVGGSLGGTSALGALTISTGDAIFKSALVNTSGVAGQTYGGNVRLAADAWLNSGNAGTAAPVSFLKAIDSLTAGSPVNLAVNASGRTHFAGVVGGTNPLANLWTNPGYGRTDSGVTRFDATTAPPQANVRTVGSQTYADDVILGKDTLLTSSGGGGVTFSKLLRSNGSPFSLAIATTGTTTFNSTVGSASGGSATLRSLDVMTGPTALASTLVNTSGPAGQSYAGAVTLKSSAWFEAGAGPVAFKSTLNSVPGVPTSLAIKASGDTRFSGAVGKIGPLASLSTNAGTGQPSAGKTSIDGGLVATIGDGGQSYSDKLILGADTTFTSGPKGAIVFNDTLDGAAKATLSAGAGALIFFQNVGGTTPLRGLSITSASSVYAASSVVLNGTNNAAADDGLVIGAGVNAVTIAAAGTSFTGFRGNGIVLAGGSTNSLLSGFDVKNNGVSGIAIQPGRYPGTLLQGMTISGNANGLWLDAAQRITIKTNQVISNTAFGLYARSRSTGTHVTRNSISGNGTNIDTKAATGGTFQTS